MLAVCTLVALNFFLLDIRPFWLATVLVVANNAAIVALWRRLEGPPEGGHYVPRRGAGPTTGVVSGFSRTLVAALAIALLFVAAHAWLTEILVHPHDPQRADMLVVIQLGIRRLLQGHTPYTMYQIPWPVTLPYGPVMWAPMVAPYLLHADIRFATLLGALVLPAACALAAIARARRGDVANTIGWLLVLGAIAFSTDVANFLAVGHTPTYWPLLPLFAWTLDRRRWIAAAILCGLLIVGRTTMIALAPVLLMAVWQRERPRAMAVVVALGSAIVVPLLPFAIADFASLRYAFYGSYQSVIKGFVWTSTDWAQNTVGVTGLLLARGWRAAVEPVQAVAMLAVVAAIWRRLRHGDDPVVWAALSLLVFSMTTLWPVVYVYFDVFLLLASAALVRDWPADARGWTTWGVSLASAGIVLLATTLAMVPSRASIDVGTASARPSLYAGFSGDERAGDRDFAWVDGTRAKVLVPSLRRRDATIVLTCEPYIAARDGRQQVTATLNGVLLGTADIRGGWQEVAFRAPARAWQIGVNELELFLATATAPRDAGEGADTRRLSIAIDRLNVTTP